MFGGMETVDDHSKAESFDLVDLRPFDVSFLGEDGFHIAETGKVIFLALETG